MASPPLFCLCLLLAVAIAGHAGASMADVTAAAEAPGHGSGAVATSCWKSVMETPEPCARDVLRTIISGTLHLSKECCAVLGRVGDKCVVDVFSSIPLGHAYLPIVNRVCGLVSSVA